MRSSREVLHRAPVLVAVIAVLAATSYALGRVAQAATAGRPERGVCRYLTLDEAKQVLGPTASTGSRPRDTTCMYAAAPFVNVPLKTPPSVLLQAWRGTTPRIPKAEPPVVRLVRIGATLGWYITPPAPTSTVPGQLVSIGTLVFGDHGHLFHISVAGTNNDLATAISVGKIVLHHL